VLQIADRMNAVGCARSFLRASLQNSKKEIRAIFLCKGALAGSPQPKGAALGFSGI
jgi:hypothetical protein